MTRPWHTRSDLVETDVRDLKVTLPIVIDSDCRLGDLHRSLLPVPYFVEAEKRFRITSSARASTSRPTASSPELPKESGARGLDERAAGRPWRRRRRALSESSTWLSRRGNGVPNTEDRAMTAPPTAKSPPGTDELTRVLGVPVVACLEQSHERGDLDA
jgi:hypothetical protein